MNRNNVLLLAGGALLVAALAGGGVAVMYSWESSANGQKWAPALAAAEQKYGLPAGLLSRQASEESGFESDVIDGTRSSSAGALGILQLEPAYFASVRAPTPFTDADTLAQIDEAAAYDAQLYQRFGTWQLALEAYNWGPTALAKWEAAGADPAGLPTQTSNYSAQILGDVPAAALA